MQQKTLEDWYNDPMPEDRITFHTHYYNRDCLITYHEQHSKWAVYNTTQQTVTIIYRGIDQWKDHSIDEIQHCFQTNNPDQLTWEEAKNQQPQNINYEKP